MCACAFIGIFRVVEQVDVQVAIAGMAEDHEGQLEFRGQ